VRVKLTGGVRAWAQARPTPTRPVPVVEHLFRRVPVGARAAVLHRRAGGECLGRNSKGGVSSSRVRLGTTVNIERQILSL
jgi:hypothetical protein